MYKSKHLLYLLFYWLVKWHFVLHLSVVSNSLQPMECSLPGFSTTGILAPRILERVAMSSFRGSSQPRDRIQVFCISGGLCIVWDTTKVNGTLSIIINVIKSLVECLCHILPSLCHNPRWDWWSLRYLSARCSCNLIISVLYQ